MTKARVLNVVATECAPKNDAKFNKWYDEVHIPLLFKYKGVKKVTRYKIVDEQSKKPRYLAIYEFDSQADLDAFGKSPEFQAAMAEMQETWKGDMFDLKWALTSLPLKTWER